MTTIGVESVAQAQDIANALATALEPFGLELVTLQGVEIHQERSGPEFIGGRVRGGRLDTIAEISVRARATRVPIAYPKVTPAPEDETTSDWHYMGIDPETGGKVYARAGAGRRLEVYRPEHWTVEAERRRPIQFDELRTPPDVTIPSSLAEPYRPRWRRFAADDGGDVLALERDCS